MKRYERKKRGEEEESWREGIGDKTRETSGFVSDGEIYIVKKRKNVNVQVMQKNDDMKRLEFHKQRSGK